MTRNLLLVAGAGVLGAGGVILSAVAAHVVASASLSAAGVFCLAHAAAVLAIATRSTGGRGLVAAGGLLTVGTVLFAAGVASSVLAGVSLGPLAPVGGMLTIGGWLVVTLGAVLSLASKTLPEKT